MPAARLPISFASLPVQQGTRLSFWLDLVSEVLRAFQHLRRSDTSQTVQIRPFKNKSTQTIGLVD